MNLTKTAPVALTVLLTLSMSFSAPQPLELIKKAKSMRNLAAAPTKLAKSTISGDNVQEMQFSMDDYPQGATGSQDDTLESSLWVPQFKSDVTRDNQGNITEIIESEYYDSDWQPFSKQTCSYDASGRATQYVFYDYFLSEWSILETQTFSYATNRVYSAHDDGSGDILYDTLKHYPGNIPDTLITSQSFDGETIISQTILTYDENDSLVSGVISMYDPDMGWYEMGSMTFTYQSNKQTRVMKMMGTVVDSTITTLNNDGRIISTEEHIADPVFGGSSSSTTDFTWSGDRCTQMLTTYDDGGQTRTIYSYGNTPILTRSVSGSVSPIHMTVKDKSIRLNIPRSQSVSVSIYTPDGKLAADLVNNRQLRAGTQNISLPGYLAPGKYICALKSEGVESSSSFILVK